MDLAELLQELNKADADAAVKALQSDTGDVVKAFRSKVFAAGKVEGKKDVKALEDERDALKTSLTAKDEEIEQLKSKTPDREAIEAPLKKKIATLEAQATELQTNSKGRIQKLLQERDLGAFRALLAGTHPQAAKLGITRKLDPDYVAVIAQQMDAAGRFRYNDKDELEVLDDDGVPYVVTDPKTPVSAALAIELNKQAPDKWALAGGSGGGGVGGQGGGSGYDPVAAGKAQAEQEKNQGGDKGLAFR